MSQASATSWVQVPMLLRNAPVQIRRKLRYAKAERKAGSVTPASLGAGSAVTGGAFSLMQPPSPVMATAPSLQVPALQLLPRPRVVDVDAKGRHRDVAVADRTRIVVEPLRP